MQVSCTKMFLCIEVQNTTQTFAPPYTSKLLKTLVWCNQVTVEGFRNSDATDLLVLQSYAAHNIGAKTSARKRGAKTS